MSAWFIGELYLEEFPVKKLLAFLIEHNFE